MNKNNSYHSKINKTLNLSNCLEKIFMKKFFCSVLPLTDLFDDYSDQPKSTEKKDAAEHIFHQPLKWTRTMNFYAKKSSV